MPYLVSQKRQAREVALGYFNMFDEWAMDPKVQSMSESLQRRHAMLLCLRNIGQTSMTPDEEVATYMRITIREAVKTKEIFKAKGFIDGDAWNVKHWEERQNGHSESLERVRRHRAKKAQDGVTVTLPSNGSNATVTLPCNPPARADLLTTVLTTVTKEEEKKPRRRGKPDEPAFIPPDWVPPDLWAEHRTVRKRKGGSLTPFADGLIVAEMEKRRAKGDDPIEALTRSIKCGYIDIWPLPEERNNGNHATKARPPDPGPTPEQQARADAEIAQINRDKEKREAEMARKRREAQ